MELSSEEIDSVVEMIKASKDDYDLAIEIMNSSEVPYSQRWDVWSLVYEQDMNMSNSMYARKYKALASTTNLIHWCDIEKYSEEYKNKQKC
jgi:hypothetical protein